jgi:hypothetical protein
MKIVNGELPVETVNGRYHIDPTVAAEALGLTERDAA